MNKRTKTTNFSKRSILKAIAGVITEMAPLNQPRKLEMIIKFMNAAILKNPDIVNDNERYYINTTNDVFMKWIKETLKSCKEFCELNLSYNEITKDINVDDPNRTQYIFTSIYDKHDSDSWKTDFIDLDSCIGKITNAIFYDLDKSNCFLCDNCDTDLCKTCILNSSFSNKYNHKNFPFGTDVPRWCKINSCKYGKAICCIDCKKLSTCDSVCDETKKIYIDDIKEDYSTIFECEDMKYRECNLEEKE